ncbi:hypothetical protein [Streptomyces sp. 8N616]|uniref:hypothetical protein n=1 Tax=Streptomyces sp. 8N616 TaxID=3457414 RepID=UPI003FD0779B
MKRETPPHLMTLRVYRLAPTGERTPVRTVVVRADDPCEVLHNPGTYPPCQCPRHRQVRK